MKKKTKAPIENVHIRTGDKVIVTSGKDKGKIGNVKEIIPAGAKVIVEGLNMITKAVKPNPAAGNQGGLVKMEAPMSTSKVMLYCPNCEKPTRIKKEIVKDKKTRVCKKCAEHLDI